MGPTENGEGFPTNYWISEGKIGIGCLTIGVAIDQPRGWIMSRGSCLDFERNASERVAQDPWSLSQAAS